MIHLQLLFRHNFRPVFAVYQDILVRCVFQPGCLNAAPVRIVTLEMRGVDLDFLHVSGGA